MSDYKIKTSTIPLCQVKRRSAWKMVTSWGIVGLIALAALAYELRRIG